MEVDYGKVSTFGCEFEWKWEFENLTAKQSKI
jgi:hypothetical protein